MARAISSLPNSVKLWQAACSQEKDKDQKSKVLKRALEMLPGSVTLWK
jgi:pre-mRNA-processing factor 6